MKEIYFAGGCFWGTEHFFSGVDGVISAVSGYAQGNPDFAGRPSYEQVYTDTTGFAETVRVCYRPEKISLRLLAELYFDIIDPLSLNQQGHDVGTRYRTGIYYSDAADLPVLQEVYSAVEARVGQPLERTPTATAICPCGPSSICVCIRMSPLCSGMSGILLPVWPRPPLSSMKG